MTSSAAPGTSAFRRAATGGAPGSASLNLGQLTGSRTVAKSSSTTASGTKMITTGRASSRPASSKPVPGNSHATATSAGATVIAAKARPGIRTGTRMARTAETLAAQVRRTAGSADSSSAGRKSRRPGSPRCISLTLSA